MTAGYLPAHMNEVNPRLSLRNPAFVPCGYQYSNDESHLFQYYQTVVCDTSSLINSREHNFCKYDFLPLAFEYKAVYHAILMVAAKGRRQRTGQYETLSLEYQQSSLNRLMRILHHVRIGRDESYWGEILVLVMLLCVCDVSTLLLLPCALYHVLYSDGEADGEKIWDGSRPAWVKHFICYRDMALLKSTTQPLISGRTRHMYKWFNKFFIYHIIMCKTAFNIDDEVSGSAYISPTSPPDESPSAQQRQGLQGRHHNYPHSWSSSETLSLSMSLDGLEYIDPYTGFSDALLLLINDIADLKYQFLSAIMDADLLEDQNLMEEIIQVCVHKYTRLKATLENIEQHLPLTVLEYEAVDYSQRQAIRKVLIATSKAYKCASLILLSETVGLLAKYYTSFTGAFLDYREIFHGYNPQDNERYATETIQLVYEVVNFTDIGLTTSWPLWPLFIAGCVVNDKWYRALVENSFETVMRRTPFGVRIYTNMFATCC